jgi:hypothetical protein
MRLRTAARLGLALVLLFPILQFVVQYVWVTHSFDGITAAFAMGCVQSLLDMLTGFFEHPVKSLLYFGALAVMSRLAFGPRGGARRRRWR